ncbi:SDR family oxidoreductase [Pseudomonas sp. RIT-PI-AD]|uniref:SDR family oxidoreductase n=1 Tax=Pseudomonas sp. RIT-PI-AD TaxID=3035294 RepID=UPI0021D82BBA|nr:SDR family oxidoreductase [Pseudomonas sp. RIT-PI-AD]
MKDKVVLITGGAGGLGQALAARFRAAGARVHGADLGPATAEVIACDVSRPEDLQDAVARVLAEHGRLDVVVANAGWVPPWSGTAELDPAVWDKTQAINVRGVAFTLAAAAEALKASRGVALLMASVNGRFAHGQQMAYSASKHAVLGIMRAAARDLGPQGVRVNALAPGPVATPALLARVSSRSAGDAAREAEALQAMGECNALRRLVTAEEVAEASHFLCSSAASGITGVVLPVDAGIERF